MNIRQHQGLKKFSAQSSAAITLLCSVMALSCAHGPSMNQESANRGLSTQSATVDWATLVAEGMRLPAKLEVQRGALVRGVARAQSIVDEFAGHYGWERNANHLFDEVEVFDEQDRLWKRILTIHGLPEDQPMPTQGLVAALEGRVLMAVSPALNRKLHPEYTRNKDAWERLLAHEIVHRLHVAILDGDEDAMGPQWFFEGFAVVGAGQQLGADLTFKNNKAALLAAKDFRSPLAYRRFSAAVSHFAQKVPLPLLVERAGADDFESWLSDLE